MRKIFSILFLFFLCFLDVFGNNDIEVISREQWGANNDFINIESNEWKEILKQQKNDSKKIISNETKEANKKIAEKIKESNRILLEDYKEDNETIETITELDGIKLAWPISKSKKIRGIVIHHTHSEYEDTVTGLKSIYKYHALSRKWGDIGYNFIIGYDGKIYEGRLGGETAVGAHDKWNNIQTIGIAIMGNYDNKKTSKQQYTSLLKLTNYLVKKYDIDLSKKTTFHKECLGTECNSPLISYKMDSIIGHRDAGHTDCPGDELYKEIDKIKDIVSKNNLSVAKLYKKRIHTKLEEIGETKLIGELIKIEKKLKDKTSKKLENYKKLIFGYIKETQNYNISNKTNKYIKIKLSYPNRKDIIVNNGNEKYKIKKVGGKLSVNGKIESAFLIKVENREYLEIESWERIPKWDKEKKYNDNKFRGTIIIYVKNDKLVVVNRLKIEDYLKGLGEVSNSEHPEKIKSIIISARTYALWYVNEARKFKGEWYDGSDDPGVFQKYLGYSLEKRSENINKLVDETKGIILKYKGKLIKPWYFSSSNGNTLSFYEYCNKKYDSNFCKREAEKFPYLVSKEDLGGVIKKGHGVGLPGTGVKYLAEAGWPAELILKYYYSGIELN